MSLLSDLLSKIKHLEPKRDVPPGLRSSVTTSKKMESQKKRLIFLAAFLTIALISGFLAVYLMETYLSGNLKHGIEQKKQVTEHNAQSINNRSETSTQNYAKNSEPQTQDKEKSSLIGKTVEPAKDVGNEQIIIENQKENLSMQAKQSEIKRKLEVNIPQKEMAEKKASPEPIGSQKILAETDQTTQDRKTILTTENKTYLEKPDSSEKDLYLYMARNYENKRDYSNALASYKKVLNIEPKNYRVMSNIASILIHLNSFEDAKNYSQMALSHKNDYVPGLINAGIALARLGLLEDAENYLVRALTLEPDNRQALLNIAILYEKKDNYKKAREHYLRLQRLGDTQGSIGLERIGNK